MTNATDDVTHHLQNIEELLSRLLDGVNRLCLEMQNVTENTTPSSRRKAPAVYPLAFNRFWNEYPNHRKRSKPDAYWIWHGLGLDEAMLPHVLAALEEDKRSIKWREHKGQYVEGINKWLRAERWKHGTNDGELRAPVLNQIELDAAGFDRNYEDDL